MIANEYELDSRIDISRIVEVCAFFILIIVREGCSVFVFFVFVLMLIGPFRFTLTLCDSSVCLSLYLSLSVCVYVAVCRSLFRKSLIL